MLAVVFIEGAKIPNHPETIGAGKRPKELDYR